MPADDADPIAIIALVEDQETADLLVGIADDLGPSPPSVVALVPPVRGVAFFADDSRQPLLDAWWKRNVPSNAQPVYVMDADDTLEDWCHGVDGRFFVRGAPQGGTLEPRFRRFEAQSPLAFSAAVLHAVAEARGVVDPASLEHLRLLADPSLSPGSSAQRPARPRVVAAPDQSAFDVEPEMVASPFDLIQAATRQSPPRAPAPDSPPGLSVGAWIGGFAPWRGLRARTRSSEVVEAGDLTRLLTARASTIVAVGSRKGGVGKSSHAAGISIVGGSVLDSVGQRAVIVDANLANPDAWGILHLPPHAATVRDTVAALSTNLEPPRPAYATTPALACLPESRDSGEYSRLEIHRLAAHLRRSFTLIVVDLSNRLPDATGGAEAAAAAFWLEVADVLVLPTGSSKADFHGVLDFLELPELPPTVVAYVVPRSRRNREHPLTKRYVGAIEHLATRIVRLPDDADDVRFAGLEGVPLDSVSRRLRDAYRELTRAVAVVANERPG